jgi:hypothetical protein
LKNRQRIGEKLNKRQKAAFSRYFNHARLSLFQEKEEEEEEEAERQRIDEELKERLKGAFDDLDLEVPENHHIFRCKWQFVRTI